jgi:guanine deaminase
MKVTPESAMREALALAEENVAKGGGPFGCVIVKDGQVIARGANQVTVLNDPTAHAEVVTIRAACLKLGTFELRGCEVYTSCEPCPMCLAACYWARVDRIHFAATRAQAAQAGFSDDEIYEEIPRPLAQRTLPIGQVLAAESEGPFDAWRAKSDKVPY